MELLFLKIGFMVNLSSPDFATLNIPKDIYSRIMAGIKLVDSEVDLLVIHRDADNAGTKCRESEIFSAMEKTEISAQVVPVIPVRMTEAWLLIDEMAIRHVAGNPRGQTPIQLPKMHEVERISDPKKYLTDCILTAANVTGRHRERLQRRFNQNRRQLLERLDHNGSINQLSSWQNLLTSVEKVASAWDDHPT